MATAKDEEITRLRGELSTARVAYDQGHFDRVEPVFRRALLFFTHGEELRQCLQCLAVLYSVKNQYSDALEMYVRLLALNETEYGKTDRRSIAVMREMSSIYTQMGLPGKADKLLARALVRERDLERPYRAELEAEENRIAQAQSYASLEPNDPMATAAEHERREQERLNELARRKKEKLEEEVRPIVSGFIVDFTDGRNLLAAKIAIAAIVLMGILVIAMILPRNPDPIAVFKAIPHVYKTADHKGVFTLLSESQSSFTNNAEEAITMPYSLFLSDWRDIVGMVYGSIYEKQYLVFRQDGAVLDGDKRIYYGSDTPESVVLDEMDVIKKSVESYKIVNGKYPDEMTDKVVLPYTNPISKVAMLPAGQLLKVGDRTWTTATSLTERQLFYSKIAKGELWPNEPALQPGGINCCSVLMVSAAGEFYDFLIRGADRYGKPLITSVPGKVYIVSLQAAKEFDTPTPPIPFTNKLLVRPRMVRLMKPDISDFALNVLNHAITYIFGIFGTASLVFWARQTFIEQERSIRLKMFLFYGIACYVLCIVYEISRLCP